MITLLYSILFWSGVTLTMPAEVKVEGTELALGSVVTVECDDPVLTARIQALTLGYAPAPGFSRVLDANALLRQVSAIAPGVAVKVVGSNTCRVLPLTELVSAETIAAAARAALQQHLVGRDLGDCTLEMVSKLDAIDVPKGKQPCVLEVAPQPDKPSYSPALVAVRLVVNGQTYRTAYTSWKVQSWREQPVLTRALKAGEVIEAGMVELRRAPIDAGLVANIMELGQVSGSAAARPLEAGRTLQAGDLVRPTIVKKGDPVILVVNSGSVRVRTPATALQSGAQGDRIKVVVEQTGREINAVIEGRDLVRISMGGRKPQEGRP